MAFDHLGQLSPAVAQALMAHDQRLTLGEPGDRGVERRADGHGEQVLVLPPAGVTRVIHGFPFLSL